LVISVSRDPAENTSTGPLAVALAGVVALAEVETLAELELEEELLLLQPAAASPTQAINTGAAICTPRRFVREVI
jgi:hypothetical protein